MEKAWVPWSEPGPWLGWTEEAPGSTVSALVPLLILSSANSCNHGKCVATRTSYVCKCAEGYGGALCDHKNDSACSVFKCHHGQCHVSDQGEPYCLCQPGFSGEHCEQGGSTVCMGGGTWEGCGGQSRTPDAHCLSSVLALPLRGCKTLVKPLSKPQLPHLENEGSTVPSCTSIAV